MNAIDELEHIINDLIEVPDMIENDKISCAVMLGSILARLDFLKQKLESLGNGDL
jgi:hypothetical protein